MLVQPLGFVVYVNMKPSLGGTFPAALEQSVHVLLPTVAMQCYPNAKEDFAIISSKIIEIPEQASI
jgi:hypothetical protein